MDATAYNKRRTAQCYGQCKLFRIHVGRNVPRAMLLPPARVDADGGRLGTPRVVVSAYSIV